MRFVYNFVTVEFAWSYCGRRPTEKSPTGNRQGGTARLKLRALNTAADEAAGGCMARRLRNSVTT